jgi:uncharacterized RDD family membrane protein YckC
MMSDRRDSLYAGLDRRVGAYLVDIGLLYAAILVVQAGLFSLTGGVLGDFLTTGLRLEAWVLLTVSLPSWAYFTLMDGAPRAATLGKRLLKLEVRGVEGAPLAFGRSLLRTLVKLLPWELTHLTVLTPVPWWNDPDPGLRVGLVLVYGLLGVYMLTMIFHPRKQGPQDLAARSLVLRGDLIR